MLLSKSTKSGLGEFLSITDPEVKSSSSTLMKMKQKLSASKILWWDRHRIDISIPKGREEKE